jgi:hypothetical protein
MTDPNLMNKLFGVREGFSDSEEDETDDSLRVSRNTPRQKSPVHERSRSASITATEADKSLSKAGRRSSQSDMNRGQPSLGSGDEAGPQLSIKATTSDRNATAAGGLSPHAFHDRVAVHEHRPSFR